MRISHLALSLYLCFGATIAYSQGENLVISGYEGSTLIGQYKSNYVAYHVAEGPWTREGFQKKSTPEGALESFLYRGPAGRTSLEVFRNYEQQLKKSGLSILFSCTGNACIKNVYSSFFIALYGSEHNNVEKRNTFPPKEITNIYSGEHYLSALWKGAESVKYVTVGVATVNDVVYTYVDILTQKNMDADMVKITADYIRDEINRQGKVVIYETLFETGKSTLTPNAATVVNEMLSYIRANPAKSFYVVGHTDDTGDFDANMTLSMQRAQRLTDELVKKGASARQLTPKGVGPLAPVGANQTDAGRTRNRRVELVERLK